VTTDSWLILVVLPYWNNYNRTEKMMIILLFLDLVGLVGGDASPLDPPLPLTFRVDHDKQG
jgi:hypothetical protein